MKKSISFIGILFCFFHAFVMAEETEDLRKLKIGYSDVLTSTNEATDIICYAFETNHPNNRCSATLIKLENLWDALIKNEVQVALIPEEVLLYHQKDQEKPIVITPLYEQYLFLVTNSNLSLSLTHSLRDQTIAVPDIAMKEYRAKPFFQSLGLTEKDIYFPITENQSQLVNIFCNFGIDGTILMTEQSSPIVRELLTSCDGKILSFSDKQIKQIVAQNRAFYPAVIPKNMYWRLNQDVHTLKSRIIMVLSPDERVTAAFLESLEQIAAGLDVRPSRSSINAETILATYEINPIPLHPLGQLLIDNLRADKEKHNKEASMINDDILADE